MTAHASGKRGPETAAKDRRRERVLEIGGRILAGAGLVLLTMRVFLQLQRSFQWSLVLVLIAEALTVVLVVLARSGRDVDRGVISVVATVVATVYFAVLRLDGGQRLAPATLTATLQTAGILLQLVSKLALGRSFGLLPANRGVVPRGPYRFVRHPIYLGHLVSHVGFLLAAFSMRNLVLYVVLHGVQIVRVLREERVLRLDPAYRAYARRVRFRLIPPLF